MKIVTPLSDASSFEPLVEAGADEFFCGYVPLDWLKRYTNIMPFNRRESILGYHNIGEKSSMKIIGRMVQKYRIPVKITFNSHYYVQSQYLVLINIIRELMDLGFDTFILADIAFIIYLREMGVPCNIHLSGEVEVYNSRAFQFFEQFKISRFIFPRRTTLDNIKNAIQNSSLAGKEYEVFFLNALCLYSGAFCNGLHDDDLPFICEIPFRAANLTEATAGFKKYGSAFRKMAQIHNYHQQNKQNPQIGQNNFAYSLGAGGCGLCRAKELMDIGVTHIKVVGRGNILEGIIKDIQVIKKALQLAESSRSASDFINTIRSEFLNHQCTYLCYYPSGITVNK